MCYTWKYNHACICRLSRAQLWSYGCSCHLQTDTLTLIEAGEVSLEVATMGDFVLDYFVPSEFSNTLPVNMSWGHNASHTVSLRSYLNLPPKFSTTCSHMHSQCNTLNHCLAIDMSTGSILSKSMRIVLLHPHMLCTGRTLLCYDHSSECAYTAPVDTAAECHLAKRHSLYHILCY